MHTHNSHQWLHYNSHQALKREPLKALGSLQQELECLDPQYPTHGPTYIGRVPYTGDEVILEDTIPLTLGLMIAIKTSSNDHAKSPKLQPFRRYRMNTHSVRSCTLLNDSDPREQCSKLLTQCSGPKWYKLTKFGG